MLIHQKEPRVLSVDYAISGIYQFQLGGSFVRKADVGGNSVNDRTEHISTDAERRVN